MASRPDPASPAGEAKAARAGRRGWGLPWASRTGRPSRARQAARRRRSDIIVAALGIALGFGCAVFPWYIFLNQEKFGIRALKFAGNGDQKAPIMLGSDGERPGAPLTASDIPPMQLDLFATGTVAAGDDGEDGPGEGMEDQPFPGAAIEYRLVYAGSGRAMIADDSGMWVVQRGSILPDNSTVSSIEQRGGSWVMVTSNDSVIELSTQ